MSKELEAQITWASDSGHGWLVVDYRMAPAALDYASSFSFIDATEGYVYLEEDGDAPAYVKAHGLKDNLGELYQDGESLEIRNLPRGNAKAVA
jgi:hypothetical protein